MSGIINPGGSASETDPIVGAITGIVKADGGGNISAAVAGTDYATTLDSAYTLGRFINVDGTGTPTVTNGLSSDTAQLWFVNNDQTGIPALGSRTTDITRFLSNRTGDGLTDDFDVLSIEKVTTQSGAGVYTSSGSVLHLSNSSSLSSGIAIVDANNVLKLTQDPDATRGHINLTTDITAGSTADGDLFRTSNGLQYNDGGTEGFVLHPSSQGTLGQFLTSGGAGAQPTWAALPTGFDATVGATGADYTKISDALAASKSRLLIIDDVTETADCAVPSGGLFMYLQNGVNVNMGTLRFTWAGNYSLTAIGQNTNSKFTYAHTTNNVELFDEAANTTAVINLANLTIDNNSTNSGCHISAGSGILNVRNVYYEPPNVANNGLFNTNASSNAQGFYVTSPGTTLTNAIYFTAGIIRELSMLGTFTNASTVVYLDTAAILDGFTNNGNCRVEVENGATFKNAMQRGGTFNIQLSSGDESELESVYMSAGTLTIVSGSDENKISNCSFQNVTFSGTSNRNMWSNVDITGNVTLGGARNFFNGVIFEGTTTISGTHHMFNGASFGSTLTVSAGADALQMKGVYCGGNVSWTGDNGRFDGYLNTAITFTLESTATSNTITPTIDQAITDSSGNSTNIKQETIY